MQIATRTLALHSIRTGRSAASLEEPLVIHAELSASDRRARVRDVLAAVGLPETHLDLYPHEISGGQQRRVGLARILMLRPTLVGAG